MIFKTERTVPVVRLTDPKDRLAPKVVMALILVLIAVLVACGGNTSGPGPGGAGSNASLPAVSQTLNGVTPVSLSMDDYLGSTVVLYFSFPG